MARSRTSGGDPARTLALLWRAGQPSRRGPRPRLDVDTVVDAAIALADEQGLEAVTMRALAARLRVSAMTLYGYVPGKDELRGPDARRAVRAHAAGAVARGLRAGASGPGRSPTPTGRCTPRTRGRRPSRPPGRRSARA